MSVTRLRYLLDPIRWRTVSEGGSDFVQYVLQIRDRSLNRCSTSIRYTRPEKLPAKEYVCSTCGDTEHDSTKQLSILKLPPVLCIQLKVRAVSSLVRGEAQLMRIWLAAI